MCNVCVCLYFVSSLCFNRCKFAISSFTHSFACSLIHSFDFCLCLFSTSKPDLKTPKSIDRECTLFQSEIKKNRIRSYYSNQFMGLKTYWPHKEIENVRADDKFSVWCVCVWDIIVSWWWFFEESVTKDVCALYNVYWRAYSERERKNEIVKRFAGWQPA